MVVTLPCVLVLLHTCHALQQSAQTDQPSLASFLRAGTRAVCWHWPHALIAAATIKFTLDVNSSHASTGDHESASANAADGGVRSDSGLFWAPAELSSAGLVYKAICSLVFYALKHLHPFDLRVLYLTPRAALGVKLPHDVLSGDILSTEISESTSSSSGTSGNGPHVDGVAPEQDSSNTEPGMSYADVMVACCLAFALACGVWLLPHALRAGAGASPSCGSTSRREPPSQREARVAAWVLGSGLLWVALLLPTLGLTGSHGWTLLAADRYCYLPAALVGAPLVAAFYDTVVVAMTNFTATAVTVAPVDKEKRKAKSRMSIVRIVWPLVWCVLVLGLGGQLRLGQLPKWRSSNALWPRAALCRPTWGAACGPSADPPISSVGANTAVKIPNSSDTSSTGANLLHWFNQYWPSPSISPHAIQLYACADVIAVYNLGRRLQGVDRAGAAGVYLAAVLADSRHGGAWNNLGSLVEAGYGNPFTVLQTARAAMASHSSSGTANSRVDGDLDVDGTSPAGAVMAAEAAEACFRVAVSLHPRTHATAWNNLGRVLHKRAAKSAAVSRPGATAWVDAGTAYQKALGVSPTYATAWFNFGLWHGAAANALGAVPTIGADFGVQVDGAFAFRRAAALAASQGQAALQADSLGKLGDLLLRTALDSHHAHARRLKAQQDHAATCTDSSHDHSHSHHAHAHDDNSSEDSPLTLLEAAIAALQHLTALRPGDAHSKSMLSFAQAQRAKFKKVP